MHEKKNIVYVGFIVLEKLYNFGNREALWEVLRMYDVDGIFLSRIKSMYIEGSACVRVKWGESKLFTWAPLKFYPVTKNIFALLFLLARRNLCPSIG